LNTCVLTFYRIALSLLFVCLLSGHGLAQLVTSNAAPYDTPDSLVRNVLLGSGVRAFNIEYNGVAGNLGFAANGIGYFDNTGSTTLGIGIDEGIIISSGNINQAPGPNLVGNRSSGLTGNLSDTDLVVLTGGLVRDASVLEFDFIPNADSVSFRFVWASEEYPEYAGSAYNDPFGFFISGPGISGTYSNSAINIAKIPGTNTEITINTLNANVNSAYYISNGSGNQGAGDTINNPDVQFDAFTIPIEVSAIVVPCDTYHIKLAVADVQDRTRNSAVFLEANSFSSSGVGLSILNDYAPFYGDTVLFEGCDSNTFSIDRLHGFNASESLFLQLSGDADTNDISGVPDTITFAVNDTSVTFNVHAIQDFVSDPDESLILTIFPDTGSCLITDSTVFNLVIREPDPLVSLTIDTQLVCKQADSIFIGAEITSGQLPYNYQWSTGAMTDSFMVNTPVNDTLLFVTVENGCSSDTIIDSIRIYTSLYQSIFTHTIADTFQVHCNQDTLPLNVSVDTANHEFMVRWHVTPAVFDTTLKLTPPYDDGYVGYTIIDLCGGDIIDSLIDSVYIERKRPTADFTWINSCVFDSLAVQDSSSSEFGVPVVDWQWDFNNDGVIDDMGASVAFPFQDTGSFPVTLAIQDSTGCVDTVTRSVLSYPLPDVSFSHANACIFDSVTFADQSTVDTVSGVGSTITQWLWSFGDGDSSTLQNPGHAFNSTGTQNVILMAWTDKGCRDTASSTLPVVSYPLPNVSFSHVNACFEDSVSFADQTTIPSVSGLTFTTTQWLWEFGNGDSSMSQNPNHSFPAPGDYVVTLTVWSNEGCSDTATNVQAVTSYEWPQPDFAVVDECIGDVSMFSDQSTSLDGTVDTWSWRFGGNDSSILQNPGYTFPARDTFSVELKVTTDLGCSDSISKDVIIYDLPDPYFTYNTICQGDSIFFQEAAVPGVTGQPVFSYFWDLDNDGQAEDTGAEAAYYFGTVVDSHIVELRVTDSLGCTDSITRQILVNPNPQAALASTNVCLDAPVNFFDFTTIQLGNVVGWTWAFGQGNDTSLLQNPAYQYASPGAYDIFLRVVSDSGCVDTINESVSVVVNPLPVTSFSLNNTCLADSLNLMENSTISSGDIVQWIWYFGDGLSDTIDAPAPDGSTHHLYANYGNYDVILAAISDSGCAVQDTQSVQMYEMPVAMIDHQKTCFNDLSQFSDSTMMATDVIGNWLWEMGDGNTYTAQHPSHQYALADTFIVSLTVTSSQGCIDSVSVADTILPLPIPAFITQNICQEDTLQLQNLSSSVNTFSIAQNLWDIDNDGTVDYTSLDAEHHYLMHDSVFVELRVVDAFGCTDSTQQQVFIHPEPLAQFDLSNTCELQEASFVDQSTVDYGAIVSHAYTFGDGQSSNGVPSPLNVYQSFGSYSVKLLVTTDSGCTDSITQPIVIHEKPVADFSVSDRCLNDSSQFNDLSTIGNGNLISWFWGFGDGQNSSLGSPSVLYSAAGNYQPTLVVESDSGCFDTVSYAHIVHQLPDVQFTLDNVCPGDSLSLTDASVSQNPFTINQWYWDVDTTGTVDHTLEDTKHYFPFPGTGFHSVELRVEDTYGCTDSLMLVTKVHPHPNAQISTVNACLLDAVEVRDSSTVDTGSFVQWIWDMGTGDTLNDQNNFYFYSSAGYHPMTLIATSDDQCRDTVSSSVRVYQLPTADFMHQDTCEYDSLLVSSASLEGDTTISHYEWTFGDGTPSQTGNPAQHLYGANAINEVQLIITDLYGCESRVIKDVEIFEQPNVAFSFMDVCDQDSVSFMDATAYDSTGLYSSVEWFWDFGDGNAVNASPNPSHVYDTAGFYDVTLSVVSNRGCVDSLTQTVQIHPLPIPAFSWIDTCAGKPFEFEDESTIAAAALVAWEWNFGDSIVNERHPTVEFDTGGLQDVKLSVRSSFGCVDSLVQAVDVMYVPQAIYEVNMLESCSPATFELENMTQAVPDNIIRFAWFLKGDSISTDPSISQTLTNEGRVPNTYVYQLAAVTDEGCASVFQLEDTLQVFPLPVAGFVADPVETTTYQSLVSFSDTSTDAVEWIWDFDADDNVGFLTNESFDYLNYTGSRTVTLTVLNEYECVDSASVDLFIKPQPKIFAPNSFTPDGNGINDFFTPKYNDIKQVLYLQIYNRWGQMMFDGRNKDSAWDGRTNGEDAPAGTYFYELHYVDAVGRNGLFTGQVNLIR